MCNDYNDMYATEDLASVLSMLQDLAEDMEDLDDAQIRLLGLILQEAGALLLLKDGDDGDR